MIDWFLAQNGYVIYGALFGLLLTGTVGFPPEDLSLILGGILIHQGSGKLGWIFAVCYAGILVGDITIYSMGRYFSKRAFVQKWFSGMSPRKIKKVQLQLEKRSLLMIFVSRHLIYLRTITFFTCGVVRMRFLRFLIADAVAALISAPIMIGLGYLAAEHHDQLLAQIAKVKWTLLCAFIIATIGYLGYRWHIKKKRSETAG